ncbi:MAG: hypothetical protein KZQ92_07620 [Candidatus Thiodiazotropha sp. (ex Lucinoma borealis)]|nr:hypothetical protein [Candidatus Thiodiazotropha sp. (ex Lucinoma borealis)]
MVSSKLREQLKDAYKKTCNQTININDYAGTDFDILFDILTAETFIAGLADRLIEGETIDTLERSILERQLFSGKVWHLDNGEECVLSHDLEILTYAKQVENLRNICMRILK